MKASERLLQLQKLLFEETDDQHELSMQMIMDKLKDGTAGSEKMDARAIKRDLDALDASGFEVMMNKGNYGKVLYSHQHRVFETYQLRLMVDAILSARFITETEKQAMIQKLKKLTSNHIAKTLPDPLIFNQTANFDYQLIKINIDRAHEAISEQRVLAYQYGKYNLEKKFVFNREGSVYKVQPYALIWQNDYYYLIGKFVQTGEFRHYRLDRMRNVQVTAERFKKESVDISQYVDQSFHMFAGEEHWTKIEFHQDLLNVMLDRFGLDADIKRSKDGKLVLNTKVKLSLGLVSWILLWGHKVRVLSPDWLVQEVKKEIQLMNNYY